MAYLTFRGQPLLSAQRPVKIEAVLFDKDGTMSRSEPHLLALATTRINHCARLAGPRTLETLKDLLQRAYGVHPSGTGLDPAGITAVAARDHNLVSTAVVLTLQGHSWPESLALAEETFRLTDLEHPPVSACSAMTDGLKDLLADFQTHGIRLAVMSNDDRAGIQNFLQHHGLHHQMAGLWSAEDRPRKPDPGAIHQFCEDLGVNPANCALIGDADSDLQMARAAGVGVVLGYRGGWVQPVSLAPDFPSLDHWSELAVWGDMEPA